MAAAKDKARWIWIARGLEVPDFWLRARRSFTLRSVPAQARLRITAFSQYVLYVNGRYVGCGPAPSEFRHPLLDEYGTDELGLRRGRNVLAVLCHNPYVGTLHGPRVPGGLWAALQVGSARGGWVTVATDRRWRVEAAEDFGGCAPRLYWTAGFTEVRDTRREPAGWTEPGFRDGRWARADEVVPRLAPGDRTRPVPRPGCVPRLGESLVRPARVQSAGRRRPAPGSTAIPFELAVLEPAHGEFYAGTFVYSSTKRRVRMTLDCDDSAAVYVNNRHAVRQGYSEAFAQWLADAERDDWPGLHRGQGHRAGPVEVDLEAGWNSLGIILYDPGRTWGFALRFEDARTGRPLKLVFSPDQRRGGLSDWAIVMDQPCPCGYGALPDTPAPNPRTFPDAAYQAAWERRRPSRRAVRGAESLLRRPKGKGPLVLADGTYARFDFGAETVGRIELEARGRPGALVDLVWGERLAPDGGLEPVRCAARQADRLVLRGGWQTVRFAGRRALRYLELIARTGQGAVEVRRLGLWEGRAPDEAAARLVTDDRRLEAGLVLARRTARACIRRSFEGSPAREADQSIAVAWLLSKVERTLLGQADRSAAALRAFAADQDAEGFFRAVVPAGTKHAIPDWNLLWILHLDEHVAWTGDRAIARELRPTAERVLDWTAAQRGLEGVLDNAPDRQPGWLLVDLSPLAKRGEVTAWQALHVRALEAASRLALLAGDQETARHHHEEAAQAAEAARKRLWVAHRELFADSRHFDNVSPTSSPATNYYALWGGLAGPKRAERILSRLWTDVQETADWGPLENPFVKYFALEALLERGQVDRALVLVRSYWGAMADVGYTTVPEVFRPGAEADPPEPAPEGPYGRPPPRVACHGWGAYPEALLAPYVLGVRPEGPGFEPAALAPMPGRLRKVQGGIWTPKGLVEVLMRVVRGRRRIRYRLPAGMAWRLDRSHLAERDEVQVEGGAPAPALRGESPCATRPR